MAMNDLAKVLRALKDKPADLQAAVDLLERETPQSSEHANAETQGMLDRGTPQHDYKNLVSRYQMAQVAKKGGSKGAHVSSLSTTFFSLNFARFRRQLKGFKKTTANFQVVGFTDSDSHHDVITKAAKGLGLNCDFKLLQLICSNGLVLNNPIGDKPWTLGEYVKNYGGKPNRSKKVWGLNIPIDIDEEITTDDSGFPTKKRSISTLSTVTKKPRFSSPGVIDVDSYSGSDPLEVSMDDIIVKYCPLIDGKLSTCVVALGQLGVWRCTQLDFTSSENGALEDMYLEDKPFQPESHDFMVMEISQGSTCYLKVNMESSSEVTYDVTEKRILRSKRVQSQFSKFTPLLLVMPNHGRDVHYQWEKNELSEWETIPYNTCVLYVKYCGTYKCTVEGEEYTFEVMKGTNSSEYARDVAYVPMEELHFGKLIGEGSYGKVHKGLWGNNTVALKRIKIPYGRDGLFLPTPTEVQILKNLNHPNIIKFMAYSMSDSEFVLVTNYVNGKNLGQMIFGKHAVQQLTEQVTLSIAVKVADAVNYMHSHIPIIIHQDLKPQNVLVSTDFTQVFVCDMGIAKIKQLTDASVTCVSRGPGTFPYMAPEMFKESRRGSAVDVYSLGCLYIELFGKKRVWPGLDGPAIMIKVLGSYETPPEGPATSHLPHRIRDLCSKLCDLNPSGRPESKQVFEEIKQIASDGGM